jgi:hypothetical protein
VKRNLLIENLQLRVVARLLKARVTKPVCGGKVGVCDAHSVSEFEQQSVPSILRVAAPTTE